MIVYVKEVVKEEGTVKEKGMTLNRMIKEALEETSKVIVSFEGVASVDSIFVTFAFDEVIERIQVKGANLTTDWLIRGMKQINKMTELELKESIVCGF